MKLKVILVLWMTSAMLAAHGWHVHPGISWGQCYSTHAGSSQRHCSQVHITHLP